MTTTGVAEAEEVASFLETVIEEAQMGAILTEAPEDMATRCATTTVHSQSHTS